jgi:DTW domain-containing protein YfiP
VSCPRCLFVDCLCAEIPTVAAATRVIVVRNRLERHRSSNTGRLAHLALPNSALVDYPDAPLPALAGATLVFPVGPATRARPEPPPRMLVVLDASWSQARRMYRKLDALRGLSVLHLADEAMPAARLRAAPAPGRVSTLEAIARALRVVESDAVAAPLEQLFATAVARAARQGRQPRGA